MKSQSRREFDSWLEANYQKLVNSATSIHSDPTDLVHHTFLRIISLKGVKLVKVMENLFAYFSRAMFFEATRNNSKFKSDYEIYPVPRKDQLTEYDLSHAFLLENFELAVDRLSWFDRTTLKLYCEGWNLTQVARESGIKPSTFHTSLHRSREKLKVYFANYYVK